MTRARRDEGGFAIVYTALAITLLMIVAAIVVDLGNARQQKTGAQAAADAAALSGAQLLNSTTTDSWYWAAANSVFHSLGLSYTVLDDTTPYASCGAGCRDYSYTAQGTTYHAKVTTPYAGVATELGVQACWSVATSFAPVIGTQSLPFCALAVAQGGTVSHGSSNGGCGATTEFFNTSTITPNAGGGVDGGTVISTVYDTTASGTGTNLPLDTAHIYFVVQDPYGNFLKLGPGPGGYTLTDQSGGAMTKVMISYTVPATMDTFSATLGARDTSGKDCGQTGWTTCTTEENLFENPDADGDTSYDVVSDGDEQITPPGGAITDVSKTNISGTFHDETNINPMTTALIVDGSGIPFNGTTTPTTSGYSMSVVPPAGWNTPSGADSAIYVDTTPPGPTPSSVTITVLLTDNIQGKGNPPGAPKAPRGQHYGLPVAGYPVTVSAALAGGGTPNATPGSQSGLTGPNGMVSFTFTDTTAESVVFSATYGPPAPGYTGPVSGSGSLTAEAGYGFNGAPAPGGLPGNAWPAPWPSPGGGNETMTWSPANLTNGWHSLFLYTKDSDQNKAGGDCGFVNWSFPATGGVGSGGSLSLIL